MTIIIIIVTRSTIAEKLARALYQGDHHQDDVEVMVVHLHYHHHFYKSDHHPEEIEVIFFITIKIFITSPITIFNTVIKELCRALTISQFDTF